MVGDMEILICYLKIYLLRFSLLNTVVLNKEHLQSLTNNSIQKDTIVITFKKKFVKSLTRGKFLMKITPSYYSKSIEILLNYGVSSPSEIFEVKLNQFGRYDFFLDLKDSLSDLRISFKNMSGYDSTMNRLVVKRLNSNDYLMQYYPLPSKSQKKSLLKKEIDDKDVVTINHKATNNKFVACTIISKNYTSFAKVLRESFKSENKDWDFKFLLCDMFEDKSDIKLLLNEIDELVPLFELKNRLYIPELEHMLFKYNIIEMNTAIKPFFLEYLIRLGYEKIVYLDPDILILDSLKQICDLLDEYNIILTPHILEPLPNDDLKPSTKDILLSGVYNLGFIAINSSDEVKKFLKWWQEELIDGCFMDIKNGFHVDQRWIDFVPAFYEKVLILKDKSYNTAYWNLSERKIESRVNKYYVEDKPMRFFHFSGIVMQDLNRISKHQNRYNLGDFPVLRDLFEEYKNLIEECSQDHLNNSYFFDKFLATDIRITNEMRSLYKALFSELGDINPWIPDYTTKILDFYNKEIHPGITRLCLQIYKIREDLQKAFPCIETLENSKKGFLEWTKNGLENEYGLEYRIFNALGYEKRSLFKDFCFGINLWGYFEVNTGVAETARTLFSLIKGLGIPFSLVNIPSEHHDKINADDMQELSKWFSEYNIYKINLMVVNADQTPYVYVNNKDRYGFKDKYNIGIWAWEIQDNFPFVKSFEYLDEIWYFSEFTCSVYKKYTDKPVLKIPYPFIPNWKYIIQPKKIREDLGLKENDVVFTFVFDFYSVFERKNPLAIIKAFNKAFDKGLNNVKLVIKSVHKEYHNKEADILQKSINENPNIIWIEGVFTREEIISLINASDCFVSLHRSEGLGLGLLEAMYLAKPVICTSYGGNTEFTKSDNSFLVNYKLVPVGQDYGPYKKDYLWAEPDIEQCAIYMREIYENRDLGIEVGLKAQECIKGMYKQSMTTVLNRLLEIDLK